MYVASVNYREAGN